jgi:excisionase family DNA binding protein
MQLLDKQQLAEFLNVPMKTVLYLLYHRKDFPKVRIGREYRFVKEDVELWVCDRKEKPAQYDFSKLRNNDDKDFLESFRRNAHKSKSRKKS